MFCEKFTMCSMFMSNNWRNKKTSCTISLSLSSLLLATIMTIGLHNLQQSKFLFRIIIWITIIHISVIFCLLLGRCSVECSVKSLQIVMYIWATIDYINNPLWTIICIFLSSCSLPLRRLTYPIDLHNLPWCTIISFVLLFPDFFRVWLHIVRNASFRPTMEWLQTYQLSSLT